jgi:SAM-dependent methyltransferase
MAEFDRFAGDYRQKLDRCVDVSGEDSEYFSRYKARYVAQILGKGCRGTLLDFGCGVGVLAALLKQELPGCRLDGYDVSAASVREVPGALVAAGTFTSDLAGLSGRYDAVVLSNVMHHVAPEHRGDVMARLCDRLAPGGKLFVFEHNPANPVTRLVVSRCEFDRDAVLLRAAEGVAWVRAVGLRVLRRDYIVFFPGPLAWLRAIEPWLAWCPAGAQYVVVGQRDA